MCLIISIFCYSHNAYASLIVDAAGNLFGTTANGGTGNAGTVFEVAKSNGTYASTPTTVVDFVSGSNGSNPYGGLVADSAGDLFGAGGEPGDYGTVFEITDSGYQTAPCYCRGTLVLTPEGEWPVEALAIGDRVVTLEGETKPVKWIGRRFYDGRFIRGNREVLPIKVTAGALDDGVPARDLFVSPEHALYLDGVLVPARFLVNGMTITQVEAVERLDYFHIELDSHDVILAEGAPAETYIECDNRLMFQNAGEFAALCLEELPGEPCAPRLGESAAAVITIREQILVRAVALGHQVTGDPRLHLVPDGVAVEPMATEDGVYRFTLDQSAGEVYVVSRSTVPAETDAASTDRRRLGVSVRRITLRDADLALDLVPGHHLLRDGFHEPEGEHRWTAGNARLPASVIDLFAGRLDIEVAIWPSELRYAERAA